MPRPVNDISAILTPETLNRVNHSLRCAASGGAEKVERELAQLIDKHKPDEVIINSPIYHHEARLKSYAIAAQAMNAINNR